MKKLLYFIALVNALVMSPLVVFAEETGTITKIPSNSAPAEIELTDEGKPAMPPLTQPDISEEIIPDSGKPAEEQKPSVIPPAPRITPGEALPPQVENYIILNFDNADLRDVISTVSSITKENFILSPGVDARITIHSATKIPVREVLSVFESVLEANGLAIVKSGNFYKVVLSTTTKQKPTEVRKGSDAESIPSDVIDKPLTQIVPV
ncbi:MAG: hypothetical protein AAB089_08450, partial [Nitrospirota bacterium]